MKISKFPIHVFNILCNVLHPKSGIMGLGVGDVSTTSENMKNNGFRILAGKFEMNSAIRRKMILSPLWGIFYIHR